MNYFRNLMLTNMFVKKFKIMEGKKIPTNCGTKKDRTKINNYIENMRKY